MPTGKQVLAVDDDEYARLLVSHQLTKRGFQVTLASSVAEAQRLIEHGTVDAFDCVVTDYYMPEATGLDLILWLKQKDPDLATVVVTGAGERDVVARTLRAGVSNFIDKPVRSEELNAAVEKAIAQTRRAREMARTEADTRAIEGIQRSLLGMHSGRFPANVVVSHHPMHGAGGDFASIDVFPDNHFLVLAADVSGHDLRAGFVSAYFQGLTRGMIERGTRVRELCAYFNWFLTHEWVASQSGRESLTSLAVAAIVADSSTGLVKVVNHGAPPVYYLDRSGKVTVLHRGGGSPLGWFDEMDADGICERQVAVDGWIMFWTDGVEDCAARLGVNPVAVAHRLLLEDRDGKPLDFLTGAPDDILVVGAPVRLDNAEDPPVQPILYQIYGGADFADIDRLQGMWKQTLKFALPDADEDRMAETLICIREAVLNALEYGCEKSSRLECSLEIAVEPSADRLWVWVDDPGTGHTFDWEKHQREVDLTLEEDHRGISLIHYLADEVSMARNGASIRFSFCPVHSRRLQP